MLAAGPVIGNSDINDNDKQAWQALFTSFLEQRGISTGEYKIKSSEDEIKINTSNATVQLAIKEALCSPDLTRQNLNYTLSEIFDLKAVEGVAITSPRIDFTNATAIEVLSGIFSEDVLFECGLSKRLLAEKDNRDQKTLRIPIPTAAGFDNIWKGRQEILTAAMIGAGINGMRGAYLKTNNQVEINHSIKVSDFKLEPSFQKVVEIQRNSAGILEFCINYDALLKLLFPAPPQVVSTRNETSLNWEITISKKDALNYLISVFNEGFMLFRQGSLVRPIFLPRGNLAKSKNLISLLLDCSGSMRDDFSSYIAHVKSLVEEIVSKSAPGDILRVVDFASEDHLQEFVLSENQEFDRRRIFNHLDTLEADGLTLLYDTTKKELKALEDKADFVQSVIIFTDGQHYTRNNGQPEDPRVMQDQADAFLSEYNTYMKSKLSHQVPSVFTMGLGTQYNKELIEKWSSRAGVPHTHLKTIADFNQILAHVDKARRPRILVKFVQSMLERFYSVYEGTLSMPPDVTIDPSQPFTVNDKRYRVENASHPAAEAAVSAASSALVPPYSAAAAAVLATSSSLSSSSSAAAAALLPDFRTYVPGFNGSEPDAQDEPDDAEELNSGYSISGVIQSLGRLKFW